MSWMLMLKKIVARIFFPVSLIGFLLLAGCFLLWRGKRSPRCRLTGKWLLASGVVLYFLVGCLGWVLLAPLETMYSPLDVTSLNTSSPCVIAVFGNGLRLEEGLPDCCRFSNGMMLRLWEAARIAKALEKRDIPYQILVAAEEPGISTAVKQKALDAWFELYAIAPEKITLLEGNENSRQEMIAFSKKSSELIVVSEAFHIPRLMVLAKKYAVKATPAPVGQEALFPRTLVDWMPSGRNFNFAHCAVNEYLGILEYFII